MPVQLGTAQTILVCVQGSQGVQAACPAGYVQSVTQAYVISPAEGARLDIAAEPFNSAMAGQFFGASFAMTIGIWWVAHGVGEVLDLIRKTRF
jgi:hypothetical protein